MIKADTSKLEKQLQDYKLEVERKLKYMVESFAYTVAEAAISNTPLGDSEKYARLYQRRTNLPKEEGIARGNWQFSTTAQGTLQFISGTDAGSTALGLFRTESNAYTIGSTFYIVNAAPYILALENNSSIQTSGQGITAPTLQVIQATYAADLKRFYDQG